jgi:hypothetical protein
VLFKRVPYQFCRFCLSIEGFALSSQYPPVLQEDESLYDQRNGSDGFGPANKSEQPDFLRCGNHSIVHERFTLRADNASLSGTQPEGI